MVGHVWVVETSATDSYNESQRDALSDLCDKVLYMFRTGPLSIIRSISIYHNILFHYTHQHMHTHTHTIYIKKSKIYIKTVKTLLHISIIRSSSGSIRRTTITRPILNTVRLTHKHTTCCHSTKVNITK